ncbi:double-strand break repair helicase AddA [Methylocystis sp. 9N]|uniref:DNA 3'-5' helicase n=1 Tax=Methylocystis borbori TaxID=3118750 RepID=A0ABU7XCT8_9HYPH
MNARPVASETERRQRMASDPRTSAWVSAHAGSGKTHVLTQRVLRLLLEGTRPSQILCLTYTKAAAANMAARVFDALAQWATLDDAQLAESIARIGAAAASRQDLDFARKLFAHAVETPGGLKIQTIHAFCEKLLHIFPFEANVPAAFRVVEDMERAELMEAARRRALEGAIRARGALHGALELVARETSGAGFNALCEELLRHRATVARIGERDDYAARLNAALGLRPDETLARVEAAMIEEGEAPDAWPALAAMLRGGSSNDRKLADSLEAAYALAPHPSCIDAYLSAFFTQKGEPRGVGKTKIVTAGLAKGEPQLLARMEAERDRLAPLIEKRKAAAAAERSLALAQIGDAILAEYERAKRLRGLLDYDDLIEGARRLLFRSSPSWVLYKLDSQIDHILLDEAQDTSAKQWDILAAIADEFCAGVGARAATGKRARSFFAVGDEKQSIFSFQGAAPWRFDEMRRDFQRRFETVEMRFQWVRLTQSFRSAPGVLQAVDDIFALEENRLGLCADPEEPAPRHESWKHDVPALIEIWEPIGQTKAEEPADWRLPLDYADANDPAERLAHKLARKIKALLAPENGECVEDKGAPRPVRAGDILILVRKRGALFEAIIRALKSEHVPVAGADRLDLAAHIAVNDLVALGRAALLPDDDLTLATLLKSPFFGFDDDDLIALAPHRPTSLYAALAQSDDARFRAAAQRLNELARAAAQTPFDFYSGVLGPGGGRKQLVARLGAEADDAIDEFLKLAASFEREQPSSLTSFLATVESLDLSIKRDMEMVGGAVRVMTAHAAKGLEAKIVFLPDTCGAPAGKHDPKLYRLGAEEDAPLAWSLGKESDPPALAQAREAHRRDERAEHQRLLYVALTRAEERLYISGCHGPSGPAAGCWHQSIRNALEASCENLPDPFDSESTILRRGEAPPRFDLARMASSSGDVDIPSFATTPAAPEAAPAPPLRPSSALAGADAAPSLGEMAARSRADAERLLYGRLAHALLQHLPACAPEHREKAAQRFLVVRGGFLDAERRAELAKSALDVIADARLAALFGPDSTAEVDIVATLDHAAFGRNRPNADNVIDSESLERALREKPASTFSQRALENGVGVSGRIDRLAVTPSEILIADFKTGRPCAVLDDAHLRQLALYRAAVAPLYPGKRPRCFLIWTQNARVVEAEEAALDAAFARAVAGA